MGDRRRLGRRAFLGGAAATVALAGGAGLGWKLSRDSSPISAGPVPSRTPEDAPVSSATSASTTPAATTVAPVAGGHARVAARSSFVFDTFDAALTGEPSTVEVLGRTHRRLIEWASFEDGLLGPGFAATWEQATPTDVLLTLRPDAWPATEATGARAVNPGDVVWHLERMLSLTRDDATPLSQQPWSYAGLDTVEAVDEQAIRLSTAFPDPFLLETLASRFALVQQREAIDTFGDRLDELRPEHLAGTGDFVYRGFAEGALEFVQRDVGEALLDDLAVQPAGADVETFLAGIGDEYLARDRRDAPQIREQLGANVRETRVFEDSPVVATFAVGAPPWNDERLRAAVSGALNRTWLSGALFGGRAEPCGVVTPAQSTPYGSQTAGVIPGYASVADDDATKARSAWEQAGGPELAEIQIDIPAIFDPLYSAATTLAGRLREVLGADVRPAVISYAEIAERVADGYYGNGRLALWMGWGPPLSSPDPSRWLIETFASDSPTARAAGFSDATVDLLLQRLRQEFVVDERAATVGELAGLLSGGAGGYLPLVIQTAEQFVRARLHGRVNAPFWSQHLDASLFVDSTPG